MATGPICASIFYYIGGYTLPFFVAGLGNAICMPFVYYLKLQEQDDAEAPDFLKVFFSFVK